VDFGLRVSIVEGDYRMWIVDVRSIVNRQSSIVNSLHNRHSQSSFSIVNRHSQSPIDDCQIANRQSAFRNELICLF
jgi:hypothetical protein